VQLHPGSDGIWRSAAVARVSYPEVGHDSRLAVEEGSFWFRHRNLCITALVRRLPPAGPLFDIGGGNGFVSLGLKNAGFDVVLVEPGEAGAANAHGRGLPDVVCATAETAGFKPSALPAIGLFDVIEHIEDDLAFARSMSALLAPGGRLYLTVPAYGWLWSHEDVTAGHFRRHTRRTICALLEAAGLNVEYASYFFRWLPLPILLMRALPYRLGLASGAIDGARMQREHSAGGAAGLADRLLAGEVATIAAGASFAFGASVLVGARRG
jgi:SAM-dependent methyltransferase